MNILFFLVISHNVDGIQDTLKKDSEFEKKTIIPTQYSFPSITNF